MTKDKARTIGTVIVPFLIISFATVFCTLLGIAIWLQSAALGVPAGILGVISMIATGAHSVEIVDCITHLLGDGEDE